MVFFIVILRFSYFRHYPYIPNLSLVSFIHELPTFPLIYVSAAEAGAAQKPVIKVTESSE